jgi:hypothetical protein
MQQPPDAPPRPADRQATDTTGGPLHPRWALLSCLGCIALAAAASVLWNVAPCASALGLGALCRADRLPAVAQVLVVALAFAVGWMAAYSFGHGLQEPRRRGEDEPLLRTLSDVEALRPVIRLFGLAGAAFAALALLRGQAQPLAVAVALLPGLVAVWGVFYRPPARGPQTAEEQLRAAQAGRTSWLFRLRTLPLIRYLWPNRPPPPDGGQE